MAKETQTIDQIVDMLSSLTVLEVSELKTALETAWNVSAAPAMMMAAAGPVAGPVVAVVEESTDFRVHLEPTPADKRVAIYKVVREITQLGLKEVKELVEGAPKVLKESAPKAEAEAIAKKVAEAGGKVTLEGI